MKTINKSIDVKSLDERLMVELEGRKEMATKVSTNACAANVTASACGANATVTNCGGQK